MKYNIPNLVTNNSRLDNAYRIAVDDLVSNVRPFIGGLLQESRPVIIAGQDYNRPWTRDAAINVWNGASLMMPDVAKDTLLSVLTQENDKVRIGGEYWDSIIWATGAWHHFLYTGDSDFLDKAFTATSNSLSFQEEREFDPERNLFRGAACFQDGVSGYPKEYAETNMQSGIMNWPETNPAKKVSHGVGLPMFCLSTNCLYYNAYIVVQLMALALSKKPDTKWPLKAVALKNAINGAFWNNEKDNYRYIVGPYGNCDHEEGMGSSFAILFNVADEEKCLQVLNSQYVTENGIPCVWPNFPRYDKKENTFGRHCGTVWPQVQGFWANAAALCERTDLSAHELSKLTDFANRDGELMEIFHPVTGLPYGGLQENEGKIEEWESCKRQTWSATAYIRMILMCVIGMRIDENGICFKPAMPNGLSQLSLTGLKYRKTLLNITITGTGSDVGLFEINGIKVKDHRVASSKTGNIDIHICVKG